MVLLAEDVISCFSSLSDSLLLPSNLHGLWVGPFLPTLAEDSPTATEKQATEAMNEYDSMCQVASPVPAAFDSFDADFVRRQSVPPFNSPVPFDVGYGKFQHGMAHKRHELVQECE
jgi:hypothetical protein